MNNSESQQLLEVAERIKEMREICGFSVDAMAAKTEVTAEQYTKYEHAEEDLPFTFIHKCAHALGVEMNSLLAGHTAKLTSYSVTRKGEGQETAKENGIEIQNLAPLFKNKIAEPYYVKYEYESKLQDAPIHTTTHKGQEFDLILSGSLKVQIDTHTEILHEGDSIYYNSSEPHGMIAIDGEACTFLAVVLPNENERDEKQIQTTIVSAGRADNLICRNFIDTEVNEIGTLTKIDFHSVDKFNFAFDILDPIARKYPDKLALLYVGNDFSEKRFTFKDIKDASNQTANYFKSLGIGKGDRVMIVLKRHYQWWFCMMGLHKLGAIVIPATNLLQDKDYEYRFTSAGVKAIVASGDDDIAHQIEMAEKNVGALPVKVIVGHPREGWHDFNAEYGLFSRRFLRTEETPGGDDTMLMFFTSGTTGYPKITEHNYKYPLGHFVTARYWHDIERDSLHFTISDTGWGKALWGKLYGQWMCEAGIFVYDFDRFKAENILPMFAKYHITTFCAPPTMFRMFIKEDISKYDLSSIRHATIAGEALNPEVYRQFQNATGLSLMEGFGQTETTVVVANLVGMTPKPGSMGKPVPVYHVDILNHDGESCDDGETGEICIDVSKGGPCGLFKGYYNAKEKTDEVWHDGWYHTGDLAWRDEDGYYWYVGRCDDVIKSSGYRIGPFEIENVIMELPYVLECGVSAAPDEIRGQVVKASIVLTKGTKATEELKKEVQEYVKSHTAPYKYPRIVEFKEELPKTTSGKIIRNKL